MSSSASSKARLSKIISGGQTGADTAALSFAIRHGIAHGGWCPRGRKREDGVISRRYRLRETPSTRYSQRTLWNVRESDGTVIFTQGPTLRGGSKKTAEFARKCRKPCLHLSPQINSEPAALLRKFLREHRIHILNVAGSRRSEEPLVGRFVTHTLTAALAHGRNARSKRPSRVDAPARSRKRKSHLAK